MSEAVIQVLHAAVPGRMRVHVPASWRRGACGQLLCEQLTAQGGVRRAECNPATGNLLVEWDPTTQSGGRLLALLALWTATPIAEPSGGAPDTTGPGDWKREFGGVIGRLPAYGRLGWALAREAAIPARSKLALVAGTVYCLLPIDLVPGFIPVWGQLDDLAFFLHGLRATLRRSPPELSTPLLRRLGLSSTQLDEDLRSLGTIAREFGRDIGRSLTASTRGLFSRSRGTPAP